MWTVDLNQVVTAEAKAEAAQAELLAMFSSAIQGHLDAKARERQYDGIQTAITYREDPNPAFAAEGAALFSWRSSVWTYATAELDKVAGALRSVPTVEDFIVEIETECPFVWP